MSNSKKLRFGLIAAIVAVVFVVVIFIYGLESIYVLPAIIRNNGMYVLQNGQLNPDYAVKVRMLMTAAFITALLSAYLLFVIYMLIAKKKWWKETVIGFVIVCLLFVSFNLVLL